MCLTSNKISTKILKEGVQPRASQILWNKIDKSKQHSACNLETKEKAENRLLRYFYFIRGQCVVTPQKHTEFYFLITNLFCKDKKPIKFNLIHPIPRINRILINEVVLYVVIFPGLYLCFIIFRQLQCFLFGMLCGFFLGSVQCYESSKYSDQLVVLSDLFFHC